MRSKPFSDKNVIRFLLVVILILAITAGYFQSAYELEQKKYARLEDMFVRVRKMLGREETQRLIDLSRESGIYLPE